MFEWVLASESPIKSKAAMDAGFVPLLEKKVSTRSAQPWGEDETERCALERLKSIRTLYPENVRGWIVVENGLRVDAGWHWFDYAVVLVAVPWRQVRVQSTAIEIPSKYILAAQRKENRGRTIGEVLCDFMPGASPQDPHAALTQGRMPRQRILTEALQLAAALIGVGASPQPLAEDLCVVAG